MVATLLPWLKINHWAKWPFHSGWLLGNPHFRDLPSRWTTKAKIYSHSYLLNSYLQWDLAYPRKMSRYGHVLVSPHNLFISINRAWQVTHRIRNVCPELQWQIYLDPHEVYKSGITGRPVPLLKLHLLDFVGPHQKVGWRKFKYPATLPNPKNGFPT